MADREPRPWWRTALVVVLMAVGLVLAPLAVVAGWAGTELTDTDRFVATLAPLASDPDVQIYLADQIVASVDQAVDIDSVVASAFGSVTIQLPPAQSAALRLLQGSAADGLRSVLTRAATRVVTSDQFVAVWDQMLRTSHRQATNLLSGNEDQALTLREDQLALNLGPLLATVRTQLTDSGFPLVAQIPTGDRYVPLATVPSLVAAATAYRLAALAAWLLPLVSVLLLAGGIALSRHRSATVTVLGAGLLLGMSGILIGLDIAQGVVTVGVSAPVAVSGAAFDAAVSFLSPLVSAVAVLSGLVLLAGVVGLPAGAPTALRRSFRTATEVVHGELVERGALSTRVSDGSRRHRRLIWSLIIVVGVAVLLLVRPLTPGLVVGTAAIAAAVALAFAVTAAPSAANP